MGSSVGWSVGGRLGARVTPGVLVGSPPEDDAGGCAPVQPATRTAVMAIAPRQRAKRDVTSTLRLPADPPDAAAGHHPLSTG